MLEFALALGLPPESIGADVLELLSYPASVADGFHPKLANELATIRHSEWTLDPDVEDVVVPQLAWFEVWSLMSWAPRARCTSRSLPPLRLPREAAELCVLMVVERGGREAVFCSLLLPNGIAPLRSLQSGPGAFLGPAREMGGVGGEPTRWREDPALQQPGPAYLACPERRAAPPKDGAVAA